MDYHRLKQVESIIKSLADSDTNLLLKLFIIEKVPMLGLLTIQKFEKNKCDYNNVKILIYEMYEDLTLTKPLPILFTDLGKSITYMYEMFQYQGYLKELHPGTSLRINIKENFWSDNVDFTFTVIDTNDQELINNRTCKAIIVSKSYSKDFLYISQEGNLLLCQQVQASRLILIRQNSFNFDDTSLIKDKISHYILLFRFVHCVDEQIPIMLMSDPKQETYDIYKDNHLIIRDAVENEKKDTFRQMLFRDNMNEIQSEVKLILTSKAKVKNEADNYTPVHTIEKYTQKNLVTCVDPNYVCSYYIKSVLCGFFFLSQTEQFPSQNFEILVLGAGIGTVNHFINKMLRGKANITSVELNKNVTELGKKYFGFNNDKDQWVYGDANEYVKNEMKKGAEKKYDMIVIDINNTNQHDGISPPPIFFDNATLEAIKVYTYLFNLGSS